jgi:hypothetical protein
MNPTNNWQAAGVCMVVILSATLIAGVFEATHPFDDDEGRADWATADALSDLDRTAETGGAEDARPDEDADLPDDAEAFEAADAVPEEVKDAVNEGLTRLGQGIQKLRQSASDAKQLIKSALKSGRKHGQAIAG